MDPLTGLATFSAAEFERPGARLPAVSRRPRTRDSPGRESATAQGVAHTSPAAGVAGAAGTSVGAHYTCAGPAGIHTAGAAGILGTTARTFAAALADGQGSLPGQTTPGYAR